MSEPLKLFLLACGLAFAAIVVRLLLQRKISERDSIAWMAAAIAILALSAFPQMADKVAKWVGVSYPPSLVFLLSTLVLLLLVLFQSIQISVLNEKLKELAQRVALYRHLELKPQEPRPNERGPAEQTSDPSETQNR
jgi:hypothetical protein